MGFWQVTAEGGRDAAIEAPFIYMALDQLAVRAQVRMRICMTDHCQCFRELW